ncbi:MAG: nucleotidyl transferase AbiEii/AbiGii toxin family protein [Ardenticatenia bacterium]|nr:nucleotidyl transferase AbiEii/AbiGii toxin family protein [Ardenticatenia bacterium]
MFWAGCRISSTFYLTGGTALAEFYLGHRLSFDLDLFTTEERLPLPFSRQVEQIFPQQGWEVRVLRRFATLVEMTVGKGGESLRLDLAVDTPFRFGKPLPTPYGVPVNDLQDLKAEKTLAYYGRAEPRDAVDLYFLLQEDSLQDLMNLAKQKDTGFDAYWFAVALQKAESFPDEAERWPVRMLKPFDPRILKARFLRFAREIMEQILGKGESL